MDAEDRGKFILRSSLTLVGRYESLHIFNLANSGYRFSLSPDDEIFPMIPTRVRINTTKAIKP